MKLVALSVTVTLGKDVQDWQADILLDHLEELKQTIQDETRDWVAKYPPVRELFYRVEVEEN